MRFGFAASVLGLLFADITELCFSEKQRRKRLLNSNEELSDTERGNRRHRRLLQNRKKHKAKQPSAHASRERGNRPNEASDANVDNNQRGLKSHDPRNINDKGSTDDTKSTTEEDGTSLDVGVLSFGEQKAKEALEKTPKVSRLINKWSSWNVRQREGDGVHLRHGGFNNPVNKWNVHGNNHHWSSGLFRHVGFKHVHNFFHNSGGGHNHFHHHGGKGGHTHQHHHYHGKGGSDKIVKRPIGGGEERSGTIVKRPIFWNPVPVAPSPTAPPATAAPVVAPSEVTVPTSLPTAATPAPTTEAPNAGTDVPTAAPVVGSTDVPTTPPTPATPAPTGSETEAPNASSGLPTAAPVVGSTDLPTTPPTPATPAPTGSETEAPNAGTTAPSATPDGRSKTPTEAPTTQAPTGAPAATTTDIPTATPSAGTTEPPTQVPVEEATQPPTQSPTSGTTPAPTQTPTTTPTPGPTTGAPSSSPSVLTEAPSDAPSGAPSEPAGATLQPTSALVASCEFIPVEPDNPSFSVSYGCYNDKDAYWFSQTYIDYNPNGYAYCDCTTECPIRRGSDSERPNPVCCAFQCLNITCGGYDETSTCVGYTIDDF